MAVNDIALGVNAHLVVHAADAADLRHMPHFAERLEIRGRSGSDSQFLEVVFTAVVARVRSRDAFCTLE